MQKEQNTEGKVDVMLSGEIRISVRGLVEFILRHGDIDNRHQASPDNAMQEGGRIHRMIQRKMGAEYQAEVTLKCELPADGYVLIVEGRADGIIHHKGQVIIDEIKGTYRDLAKMRGPQPLHLAQAKCYAYMYGVQEGLTEVQVRLTYCNIISEEQRYFYENCSFAELEEWFQGLLTTYRKWTDYSWKWRHIRQSSIEGLPFPFPYREGQKELVANVYRTIYHGRKLFLEAPTGVGKTISTIYPAIQAMGRGMGDKLFYLTAKTITRTVADETFQLLRKKGLRMKSVILTARDKICFMENADCNPEYCPYAKGHYDRINDAVFDLLTSQESFSRENIEDYARKYQVCPFEMCLDMSLFADAVICDYNYLFDPHIYLKRFFGETSKGEGMKGETIKREVSKKEVFKKEGSADKAQSGKGSSGNYIFLIDEAHNLLERGREMYSALLWKEQFVELRREIKLTIMSEIAEGNIKPKKSDISGQMTLGFEEEMTFKTTYMPENVDGILKLTTSMSNNGGGASTLVARDGSGGRTVSALMSGKGKEKTSAFLTDTEDVGQNQGEDSFTEESIGRNEGEDSFTEESIGRNKGEDSFTEERIGRNEGEDDFIEESAVWEEEDDDFGEENDRKKKETLRFHGGRSILVRQGYAEKLVYQLKRCNQELLILKRECPQYCLVDSLEAFVQNLMRLQAVMDDYLSEQEEVQLAVREQLLDFYFEVNHFLYIYDLIDDNYVMYTQLCQDGSFFVKLLCVNPGQNLKNCMLRGRSTILFSATFLPIQYYKKLLGGDKEDYEVYAQSVFHPAKRALLIASDVTSKYTRRSQAEYYNIARYIEEIVKKRHGNYMVFCPSYSFLHIIYEIYMENFGKEGRECIIQNEAMSETEREEFLARFQSTHSDMEVSTKKDANAAGRKFEDEEKILIGFCVLGGIFSEGIDLKNDSLIGVMIVGTGLPQVCDEREILKDYFNENGEDGFDYSYRYPGMNKVLQAAGRVIRTVDDVGVIALLDERFLQFAYRRLFPLEWQQFDTVTVDTVAKRVERFWDEWL